MTIRSQFSWRVLMLAAALAGVCALDGATQSKAPAAAPAAPVPFQTGERLEYRVLWTRNVVAAQAAMFVRGQRTLRGRETWQLEATARTVEPIRYVYSLDDRYASHPARDSMASLQFDSTQIRQRKKEDSSVRFAHQGEPAPPGGPSVRVPRGTRDPLAALYYLRTVDWDTAGEVRTPVYDGRKLYELRARRLPGESEARVPAGNFTAVRIEGRLFERNAEVEGTRFVIWLAGNAERTPVVIEAALPFGSLRVELTAALQIHMGPGSAR